MAVDEVAPTLQTRLQIPPPQDWRNQERLLSCNVIANKYKIESFRIEIKIKPLTKDYFSCMVP
jgi:hypothetical protein